MAGVRYGKRPVVRVMLGGRVVWRREAEPYVRVSPTQVWLAETVAQADVRVYSNTGWSAAPDGTGSDAPAQLSVAPIDVGLPQQGSVTVQVCCPGAWTVRAPANDDISQSET